jgi:antitoxin component of MazEF toxin-antitoxin module
MSEGEAAATRQRRLAKKLNVRYTYGMQRKFTKVGGSLAMLIPRDFVEAMGISPETSARLTLVGRQLVIEPADRTISDAEFQRAFGAVMRRYGPVYEGLAEYDRGTRDIGRRTPRAPRRRSR